MKIIITKIVDIVWLLKGIDGYGFGSDKKLYNIKKGVEKQMKLNGSTRGYWIGRKFYTLEKLRPLFERPDDFDMPF